MTAPTCAFPMPTFRPSGRQLLTHYVPCGKSAVVRYRYTQRGAFASPRVSDYCHLHFYGDATVAKLADSYTVELLVPTAYPMSPLGARNDAATEGQNRQSDEKDRAKQRGKRAGNARRKTANKRGTKR